MKGHREGIAEDRLFVTDSIRYGEPLGFMTRDLLGKASCNGRAIAVVNAALDVARTKIQALGQLALPAKLARLKSARDAGQPGVEQHPFADAACCDLVPNMRYLADHLVPEYLGPGDHGGHGIVRSSVHEHLLVVASTQTAQPGFRH